jgi:hypothetical protein
VKRRWHEVRVLVTESGGEAVRGEREERDVETREQILETHRERERDRDRDRDSQCYLFLRSCFGHIDGRRKRREKEKILIFAPVHVEHVTLRAGGTCSIPHPLAKNRMVQVGHSEEHGAWLHVGRGGGGGGRGVGNIFFPSFSRYIGWRQSSQENKLEKHGEGPQRTRTLVSEGRITTVVQCKLDHRHRRNSTITGASTTGASTTGASTEVAAKMCNQDVETRNIMPLVLKEKKLAEERL